MNRVRVLDCTLRDGGYINGWNFGQRQIKDIIHRLGQGSIDIIECGFLRKGTTDKNKSLFDSIESVREYIGDKNPNVMYVGMIQLGKAALSNEEISPYDGTSLDGIRITFHEYEIEEAFVLGQQLIGKGYKVFIQPVGTTTYTDEHLLFLINKVNDLKPYGFYMVDTLGTMYRNDLLRMFYLIDNNLDDHIVLGFHSHNNMQLAFSNAQELIRVSTTRKIIIDSSAYGMGRGSGNLCTELICDYINRTQGLRYDTTSILSIIDEYINPIRSKYSWGGYDISYFVSAANRCHPNYTTFLLNKQTLHVRDIQAILSQLDFEKCGVFDADYANEQYLKYMEHHVADNKVVEQIKEMLEGKNVVVLAPGKSLSSSKDSIVHLKRAGAFIVSVNFIPDEIPVDMMFISNMKRFSGIEGLFNVKYKDIYICATSNITTKGKNNLHIVDYSKYLNEEMVISDNAGLMCINLLKSAGVKEVTLAGFDGFGANQNENYYEESLVYNVTNERLIEMNRATSRKLKQLETQMSIRFLTQTTYMQ